MSENNSAIGHVTGLITETPTCGFTVHLELFVHSYFNVVKVQMIDMVPKAIDFTLVDHSKEELQKELLQELYKPEVPDDLLKVGESDMNRRDEVISMILGLHKAEE